MYLVNGMPRSGSTLLCNILAQNPRFHSTGTSALVEILYQNHISWKQNPVVSASEKTETLNNILKSIVYAYNNSVTDRPIVFNKSRGWATQIELLENIIQKPIKMISTVRKVTCILASLEKLYRKELKQFDRNVQINAEMSTLENRLMGWSGASGLVGCTYNNLKDACVRGHRSKIMFIDFDFLTNNPDTCLKQIYEFLEEPYYQHNYDKIEQYTHEKDTEHGLFSDMHTIRSKLLPVKDDSIEILGNYHSKFNSFVYDFS